MNTTQLKRFATEARKILLQGVAHRMEGLGFDLKTGAPSEKPQLLGGGAVFMGTVVSESFYNRWMSLFDSIRHRGVRDVAEEAAYTWFNRLIAIRILSKQGFISPVLQYESEDIHIPLIVSEARHGRMPEMNERTRKELDELLNDDSKTNEQFALLIVAFCHSNPIINRCFGAITDYTELLLPQDILREGGYVDMLNHTAFISEEDYGSSTLIGWLYQFYISDRKDEVFAKKGKYDADEIAPATQIFTPEWIVEYMVQNTIGRIYLDNNPYAADELKPKWKYLVDQEQRDDDHICHFDNLEDLRFADLGCGSGHIVGYMFEVLLDLYLYEGYSRLEAVEHILKENLTGVDIDQRAKQLATFALLLKACQKDKSFTDAKVMPNILDMPEPFTDDKANEDNIIREQFSHFILGSDTTVLNEIVDAIKLMDNAKTLGSIMKFNISERTRNILQVRLEDYEQQNIIPDDIKKMMPYVRIILALTQKYTALVMNPPYMGRNGMNDILTKYIVNNYPNGRWDLFAAFMYVSIEHLIPNGKTAMINMQSWMFLDAFKDLRIDFLKNYQLDNMLHLGPNTFDELGGEVVQNTAFIFSKSEVNPYLTIFYRLVEGKNCNEKGKLFLTKECPKYTLSQTLFGAIPGSPVGYWLQKRWFEIFKGKNISSVATSKAGVVTGKDDFFLKLWFEVNNKEISYVGAIYPHFKKYHTFQKGGSNRRYYGNNEYVIRLSDYWNPDYFIKSMRRGDVESYFMPCIGWSYTGSTQNKAFRYVENCVCGTATPIIIPNNSHDFGYILAFLNSNISSFLLPILNPTLSLPPGYVNKLPFIQSEEQETYINKITYICVNLSKLDWDAHETSWDFAENPLVAIMKQAEGEEPIASEEETDGFKQGNQWFATKKPMVSRHEIDGFAAENHHAEAAYATDASSCDDRHALLQQPCNDITKPLYDDYNALVNSLQGLCHPTDGVTTHGSTLELCVNAFEKLWTARFMQLHANEEELNRQFIDIYGLQDELTSDVPLNEITILQQGEISIE